MREAVVAQFEAVLVQSLDDLWVPYDLAPNDEEGGRRVKPSKRGSDLRSPAWVGAVVEGERNPLPRRYIPGLEAITIPSED
jgi:hypothetical protein